MADDPSFVMRSESFTVTSTVVLTWHANGAWGGGDDVQYVKTAQDKRYAKIKMHVVLALGLGYKRLIYTAFVKLCNKHEDDAWDAPSFHEHS